MRFLLPLLFVVVASTVFGQDAERVRAPADTPDPKKIVARSAEANRRVRTFEFDIHSELLDSKGTAMPGYRWNAHVVFRRGVLPENKNEFDPRGIALSVVAKGRFPSSLDMPGAEEKGEIVCAYDGKTVRLRGIASRRFLELPIGEAKVPFWQLAESQVVPQALWIPGFVELTPGARFKYAGEASVGNTACHLIHVVFGFTKCLPAGVKPEELGFELMDPQDDRTNPAAKGGDQRQREKTPAGAGDGFVCYRVKARMRLWIGKKDLLLRRLAYKLPGGPRDVRGAWSYETFSNLRTGTALADSELALKPHKGDRVEKVTAEDLELRYGTPEMLARRTAQDIGNKTLPPWELKDPAGNTHRFSDYEGKVLVLDFWGTWCGPCVEALPAVQAIHEEFVKTGQVVVIGVACNERDKESPARVMKEKGCTYTLLLGGESLAHACRIRGFPTILVVGTDGRVTHTEVGIQNKKAIVDAVRKALAAKPAPATK